jgi:hypothetical protein
LNAYVEKRRRRRRRRKRRKKKVGKLAQRYMDAMLRTALIKQLYILIELEIFDHPVYFSISWDSFIGKKFEYSEHTVH